MPSRIFSDTATIRAGTVRSVLRRATTDAWRKARRQARQVWRHALRHAWCLAWCLAWRRGPHRAWRHASLTTLMTVVAAACAKEPVWRGAVVQPERVIAPTAFADSTGQTVQLLPAVGGAALVFFGYTKCPDVCPTTLADWVRVKRALGKDADRVRFVFVTVDPERDTPAQAQRYAAQFDPTFIGLSTNPARTDSIETAFGVASARDTTSSAAGYLMGHSSQVFLMDDTGKLRVSYGFGAGWDAMSSDLQQLLR